MRLTRDQLAFMGLVALDEVVERLRVGPYDAPFALRVVLGMLYGMAEGDRSSFDAFWRAAVRPVETWSNGTQGDARREPAAMTAFNGICRSLGFEQSIYFKADLTNARRAPLPQAVARDQRERAGQPAADEARRAFAARLRRGS